ncbi:MAG: PHP domain-containing protein [Acidobacteria bacterium]|nr:PHP domain-containing protein [Acidobacteriota bacterium]
MQSAIQIKPLAARLSEFGMKACAITDSGNLYGAITFYNKLREKDVRPIIGYEALLTFESRFDRTSALKPGERPFYPVVLLARNIEGYQNLVWLASKAFTEGFHHRPRIDLEILKERAGGLIALSGGEHGPLNHYLATGNRARAEETARIFRDIFGPDGFYIEVQNHGIASETDRNRELAALASELGIELVATNDAFYLNEEDARAQEVLMCIGEGKTMVESTRTVLGVRSTTSARPPRCGKRSAGIIRKRC